MLSSMVNQISNNNRINKVKEIVISLMTAYIII